MSNKIVKPLSLAIGAAFIGSMTFTQVSQASELFALNDLSGGYMVTGEQGKEGSCGADKAKEGKCGEGKCGADKAKEGKCGEGKCGADKAAAEAHCGADKTHKAGEGTCAAAKAAEGKCGEGKCGEKKGEEGKCGEKKQ